MLSRDELPAVLDTPPLCDKTLDAIVCGVFPWTKRTTKFFPESFRAGLVATLCLANRQFAEGGLRGGHLCKFLAHAPGFLLS